MLVLFSTSICFGQDLEKHEWKDRVLLILSSDSISLNQQIKSLSKDIQGLEERKLVVYQILPKKYLDGIEETKWIPNSKFFDKMKRTKKDFEVILLGLDGGVKLRQNEPITLEKLFTLIDGMPMRRQEIKNEH